MCDLTPLTVCTALNVPEFYKNKHQFCYMLEFLFTNYRNDPVWQQIPRETYFNLGLQLWGFIDDMESEAEVNAKGPIIHRTYYAIMNMTRGNVSNAYWHAYSSPEFLSSMYKIYRQMFWMRTVPDLPLFGHLGRN